MRIRPILLLTIILAGCTMDQPNKAGPAGPKPASGAKYKIAGIGFQNDQFFKTAELGMKDAGTKQGVNLTLANSGGSLDREIQLVDTYVAGKVDALVVAPT